MLPGVIKDIPSGKIPLELYLESLKFEFSFNVIDAQCSILSDDATRFSGATLTELVRDQLAYSIPPIWYPAKKTLTLQLNYLVSYQTRSLSTIIQRMPLLLGNLLDRVPAQKIHLIFLIV